jgi:hypothetical protein
MVLRNQVAFCAREACVVGYPFLAGDLTMAGAALLGFVRQKGVMRIVARHASLSRVMILRDNLGEPGGSRRIVAVAERTISALSGGVGNEFIGRLNMPRRGAMAYLTRNIAVIRLLVKLMDLLVAVDASPVTPIAYLLSGNFVNGFRSVMPIGPESGGNKEHTSHYQGWQK